MTLTLLALLLPSPAFGFAPSEQVFQGTEPVRLQRTTPAHQARLREGKAWQKFLHSEGVGWEARFDQATDRPHRAWGPGIDLGPTDSPEQVEAGIRAFLERHPDLAGVKDEDLVLTGVGFIDRSSTWYVEFEQRVGKWQVPIYRSHVTARIRHGKLVLFGLDTYPGASTVPADIAPETAVQVAVDMGPEPFATHAIESVSLVLLPEEGPQGITTRLCYEVRTRTADPVGIWVAHVDALKADLVNVYNEVRYATGNVQGVHDARTVNGDKATSPLPLARISSGNDHSFSDASGAWSLDVEEPVLSLNGEYIRVLNGDGDQGSAALPDGDFIWNSEDATNVTLAEIDTFVFLHQVRDWGLEFAPEVRLLNEKLRSYVNLEGSCNAYYDGDVNFFQRGDGCNNTGRIADVNFHEWGHGFHQYSLITGEWDGSVSEGIGDVIAFLQTGDPIIAPYFGTNGWGIRNVAEDRAYPQDWVGQVHTDGLIFAGAVWDLWGLLAEEMDVEPARDLVSQLFVDAIKAGPTVPDTYDEFVVADDDDGDLSNGTPHQCTILEAFQRHGLGPAGSSGLIHLQHDPVLNHAADEAIFVEAGFSSMAQQCADFTSLEGRIRYSVDGGNTWATEDLDSSDLDRVSGQLGDIPYGTVVHYYLEVETDAGDIRTEPAGATINPHSFFVGDLVPVHCEDFEDGMGAGYTHELVEGSDEEGADDWQLGDPRGEGGDPDFAWSGDHIWGNDLGWGIYNGEYKNDKRNRLLSAPIDVSGTEGQLVLQFRRWLTVEDGVYDRATVHVDGEEVWSNHSTVRELGDEHHVDRTWALHTLLIQDADADGEVTLSWEMNSDQGLTFGGWNIDDVCVYEVLPAPVQPGDLPPGTTKLIGAGGCACSSNSGSAPFALAWLLGAVGLVRRRRTAA